MCLISDCIRIAGLLPILILLLASCATDAPQSPTAQIQRQSLRFGVPAPDGSVTRVTNNGVSSTFVDKDKVGCVIAFRNSDGGYDFQATTEWHYCATTRMLVLDAIYKVSGSNDCASHFPTADDVICRMPDTNEDDGYVQLNTDGKEYCFFFYYPFINSDLMIHDFLSYVRQKDPYKLMAPFSGFRMERNPSWTEHSTTEKKEMTVTGMPDATTSYFNNTNYTDASYRVHPHFDWKQFPCFVSIAQGSVDQLNNSNFMWVSYVMDQKDSSRPVTKEDKETHYTVNLKFRKKMAAIDLIIDNPEISLAEGDIYYRNIPEEAVQINNGTYSNYILVGRKLDLSTGQFSDYPQIFNDDNNKWKFEQSGYNNNTEYPCIRASHLCDAYEDNDKHGSYNKIRPCPLGGGVFRVILPPQSDFRCELHVKRSGTDCGINIYDKLPQLRENTLYTIRLRSIDEWDILINDWEDGDRILIEEDN